MKTKNPIRAENEKFKPKGIGEKKEAVISPEPDTWPEQVADSPTDEKASALGQKIYVLSIGINCYENKKIPPLNGCVRDVESLKRVLKSRLGIPEDHYKVLINEAATRKGIIDTFRDHFSMLKDGDTAIFHYSGHGSQEPTTEAFVDANLEVQFGKNEVIVCHDSRQSGIYNIADKELRWLIHELQYPVDGPPKNIHFVAIFDCCHSGSMLRLGADSLKVRLHPSDFEERPLEAYLEGQYVRNKEDGKVQLPAVHYISLTACSPTESAIEMASSGGLFTDSLCQVLRSAYWGNRFPSYAELYAILRDKVKNNTHNRQTPRFEYAGRVDPNTCFLQYGDPSAPFYPSLIRRDREWVVAFGAIHGIDQDTLAGFEIPIFELGHISLPIAYAVVTKVELEYTEVRLLPGTAPLNPIKTYLAGLVGKPLPIRIHATSQRGLIKLANLLENAPYNNRFLQTLESSYELRISADDYRIYRHDPRAEELILGVNGTGEAEARYILDQLSKIAKWEQINQLQTPKFGSLDPHDLSYIFKCYKGNHKLIHFVAPDKTQPDSHYQIRLSFDPEEGGIPYKLEVENNSEDTLWYYLIHLNPKYGITQKHENYIKDFYPKDKTVLFDSYRWNTGLGFTEAHLKEVTDTFLLIATKEELSIPSVFAQESFGSNFGQMITLENQDFQEELTKKTRGDVPLKQNRANWTIKRLEVKLTK